MTWKRVATAVVLIPFVVGLVVAASTSWLTFQVPPVVQLDRSAYLAVLAGDHVGRRHDGVFCWAGHRSSSVRAVREPEEDLGRRAGEFCWIDSGGGCIGALGKYRNGASDRHGGRRECGRADGGSAG